MPAPVDSRSSFTIWAVTVMSLLLGTGDPAG
jgi:hypothetical protein